jgi:hypothetical protein
LWLEAYVHLWNLLPRFFIFSSKHSNKSRLSSSILS